MKRRKHNYKKWTPEELKLANNPMISHQEVMRKTERSYSSITHWRVAHNIYLLEKVPDTIAPIYDDYLKPKADIFTVAGDLHIPLHDTKFINYMNSVSKKRQSKILILGGDTTDQKGASRFLDKNTKGKVKLTKEFSMLADFFITESKFFDTIYVIAGDHDERLLKRIDFNDQFEDLINFIVLIVKTEIGNTKIIPSNYMYCIVKSGKSEWRITHPDRATKRPTTKALLLANKFRTNVIQFHGHTYGQEHTTDGKLLAVCLGCMTDIKKHEYTQIRDTGHSMWTNQFGIVENGELRVYDR